MCSMSSSSCRSNDGGSSHVNVTAHPYAAWAGQQIVEAFGEDGAFKLLIRDRDGIFGPAFDRRVNNLGVRQLRIARRSPWQNGYAERLVGTFRRELTDPLIVLSESASDTSFGASGNSRISTTRTGPACRSTEMRRVGERSNRPKTGR